MQPEACFENLQKGSSFEPFMNSLGHNYNYSYNMFSCTY